MDSLSSRSAFPVFGEEDNFVKMTPHELLAYETESSDDENIPNSWEDLAEDVDGVVEEFFSDPSSRQGRIAASPSAETEKKILPERVKVINHENGIFGSYLLEDARSISKLVIDYFNTTYPMNLTRRPLKIDCFNYEKLSTLVDDKMKGNCVKRECSRIYQDNHEQLSQWKNMNKVDCELHYINQPNDLTLKENDIIEPSEDWDKFNRFYSQNMIFFNPFAGDIKGTKLLLKRFFDYAKTNLDKDGVVTIMWNPKRRDMLKVIKIVEIAKKSQFKIIKRLSGEKFQELTEFKHLKNDRTLNKAIIYRTTAVVEVNHTDTIVLFKKKGSQREISSKNVIATVLVKKLPTIAIDIL